MLKLEINGGTSAATPTATSVAISAVKETTTPVNSPSPTYSPPSPPLSPQQPPQSPVVLSPCAACKILRRRCAEKCVLAPYFPPTDPAKFTIAHRVFGASNIIKFLQVLLFSFLLFVTRGYSMFFLCRCYRSRVYMTKHHICLLIFNVKSLIKKSPVVINIILLQYKAFLFCY